MAILAVDANLENATNVQNDQQGESSDKSGKKWGGPQSQERYKDQHHSKKKEHKT